MNRKQKRELRKDKDLVKELYSIIVKYLDNKYDLNKEPTIFVSGDGGSWIKGFDIAFPNAIYVLDPFHYFNKKLSYILKKEPLITSIADSYLRNKMIDEFKLLVKVQIEKYPEQKNDMIKTQKFLIENIVHLLTMKANNIKLTEEIYQKFKTSESTYKKLNLKNSLQTLEISQTKLLIII